VRAHLTVGIYKIAWINYLVKVEVGLNRVFEKLSGGEEDVF